MTKIAQYELLGELGRGGMGVVYEALDPRLERHVAIKVIELPRDPHMSEQTRTELVERFKREARASAKLNHPNIVSIFDFGEEAGRYYMVMEYLQGRNLAQLLKVHSPLSVSVALRSMIQVCEALEFAHHQGIIHRDIKPANIVILDNGTTKLTDFGIARLESSQSDLTQAGSILGSLLYISPEQLLNPKAVDKRADLYSLGVTAYEILTGQLPYSGASVPEIVIKIMQTEPRRPSELNPQISAELDHILFKAMAKTPELRYDSARELAADLRQILGDGQSTGSLSMPAARPELSRPTLDLSLTNRGIEQVVKHDDHAATQYGSGTLSTPASFPTAAGQAAITSLRSREFTLVEGIDDPTLFNAMLRILRGWHVENLSTNTMLEAIYKFEGRSQGLIINNAMILLIYKGLLIGAVLTRPELTGAAAWQHMAAWQKFEMTRCVPPDKEESWLVLLAMMSGASQILEHQPFCAPGDVSRLLDQQRARNFTGLFRLLAGRSLRWIALLDGQQVFSITMPYPEGSQDNNSYDMTLSAPRFNLLGPSLRKLLVEAQLQLVSKSINRPMLSQYYGPREKQLTPEMMEEALRNLETTPIMPRDMSLELGNRNLKYSDLLRETQHVRIVEHLIYDHMYALSRATAFASLKKRFSWVWLFKSVKFLQPVKVGSFSATFDILAYNSQDQLIALMRIEPELTAENLEQMLNDVRLIKNERSQDDIQAAILLSQSPLSPQIVTLFQQQTTRPGLMGLGDSERGFVKTGWNKGFYLFLAELGSAGEMKLKAPALALDV
jgi:serine/threonine protein kinase